MSVLTQAITEGQELTILWNHTISGDAHAALKEMRDYYTTKVNISTLRSEFHRDLSVMRMTRTYPEGGSKFLAEFQALYLDLEEATQKTTEEHEKIGQLTVAVSNYGPFETIMLNLELVAQSTNTEVKYSDAIQNLVRKMEVMKVNIERKINPVSGNHFKKKKDDEGQRKWNDFMPRAEYDKLTKAQKAALWEKRKETSNKQSNSMGITPSQGNNDASIPSEVGGMGSTDAPDGSTVLTQPSLRQIMASQTANESGNSIITDPDGSRYAVRHLNVTRCVYI